MSLVIAVLVMGLIFGGLVACFVEWLKEPNEYEVWMSGKSDVYLEIFGHKPMTEKTQKLIDDGIVKKMHVDLEQQW